MRRIIILVLFLISIISIVGCSQSSGNIEKQEYLGSNLSVSNYYPFKANTYYDYEGIGNEFAEQQAFCEYIEGEKAQVKVLNPGTTIVKVLEHSEDSLMEVYYEAEFYHIENMISNSNERKDILLKEPLEVGNSWSDPEGHKRSITGIDIEILTPYELFKAIEVTTELGEGAISKRYYAKDIGLVGSIYEDENGKVQTLLKSIKEMPLVSEVLLFYPVYDEKNKDILNASISQKIEFKTNEKIEKILEKILKNPPLDELFPVISDGVIINTIVLDRGKWVLKADFSQEIISEMNMGSTEEAQMLKSLVNTLGVYYDTEEVFITVDGKPYESGHYALKEGESFKVDLKNIKDLDK